ncbi:MAG: SPOR domain-containing protein [Gemmatimonadota bacterium]|nr:MAG: SPOR domain-containing protein [Gemmatimonadota bacterium]
MTGPRTTETDLKLHLSKRTIILVGAVLLWPALSSCDSGQESARARGGRLERVAWLGSSEGWGLLGLPLAGGPLTYRRAENLESPTWAPPEFGGLTKVWPGDGAIWVQFDDSRIGLYDYATGHLLSYEGYAATETAVALPGQAALVIAPGGRALELVSESEPWRFELEGQLLRLVGVGEGQVVAVAGGGDSEGEFLVLQPPEEEPLGRRSVTGVRDFTVTAWGERLYYLAADSGDLALHGLSLPSLEVVEEVALPQPGRAVAATPSSHRLYIAAGRSLYVFDRLRGELMREMALPAPASALRFSPNGANLLARLEGVGEVAVLRVGVDSVLGVIQCGWDENLPMALPGGRLVAAQGTDLVLYDLLRLGEIARVQVGDQRVWLTVEWQPPRPRTELTQRSARRTEPGGRARAVPGEEGSEEEAESAVGEEGPAPGYYAVVLAARARPGVDDLVTWLQGLGYPATVDPHEDPMGVLWFRAMVGPYARRPLAEAAARSLNARYGYKPWILSIEDTGREQRNPADSAGAGGEPPAAGA